MGTTGMGGGGGGGSEVYEYDAPGPSAGAGGSGAGGGAGDDRPSYGHGRSAYRRQEMRDDERGRERIGAYHGTGGR